jgi:hypothetical protein
MLSLSEVGANLIVFTLANGFRAGSNVGHIPKVQVEFNVNGLFVSQ